MGSLRKKNKTHKKDCNGHFYCLTPSTTAVLRHCLDCPKLHNVATVTVS